MASVFLSRALWSSSSSDVYMLIHGKGQCLSDHHTTREQWSYLILSIQMTIRMLANVDNAWRLVALLFIDHYTIISQLTNWKWKELYCRSRLSSDERRCQIDEMRLARLRAGAGEKNRELVFLLLLRFTKRRREVIMMTSALSSLSLCSSAGVVSPITTRLSKDDYKA